VGEAAPDALRRRLERTEIAVKNQDNREHDIFDSDDYLQDHGGMVAAIRVLSGRSQRRGSAIRPTRAVHACAPSARKRRGWSGVV